MKKNIFISMFIICLVCVILPLSGCTRKKDDTADRGSGAAADTGDNAETMSGIAGRPCVGDMGLFYINGEGMLEFTDAETRQSSVVCDRANCAHESYNQNEDTECKADAHEFESVIQQGQSLYLLGKDTEEDFGNYRIYRQDLNGDNREQITEIKDSIDLFICECWANEKYLVMECQKILDNVNGKWKNRSVARWGFLVYEWETKKSSRCILPEEELNNVSQISAIDGMTLEEDGFSACLMCKDSKYDSKEAAKLSDNKREAYDIEHRCLHYIKFKWNNLETYDTVNTVTEGGCRSALYRCNRLYYIDAAGDAFLADFSGQEDVLPQPQGIVLKGVADGGQDTRARIYGLNPLYAVDPEGRLYYAISSKNKLGYYCFDPESQESFYLCDSSGYVIDGACSKTMLFIDTNSQEMSFLPLSFDDFRETGVEKLGGDKKEEQSQKSEEDNVLVWSINDLEERLPATDAANEYLKKKGKNYEIRFVSNRYAWKGMEKRYQIISETCESADIISLPSLDDAYSDSIRLIQENRLMDLTDIVENGSLGKQFAPLQWEAVKVDGKIYSIPCTETEYRGKYFAFRRKYFTEKDLKEFDGTLDGVEKMIRKKGKSLQRSIYYEAGKWSRVGVGICDLGELVDGDCRYGMYFPDEGGDVDLWFRAEDVRGCYRTLNRWYRKGILMTDLDQEYNREYDLKNKKIKKQHNKDVKKVAQGDYMVFIGSGGLSDKIKDPNEVVVFRPKTRVAAGVGESAAIPAATEKKEMAVDFLNLLYSDQKLADMLTYGEKGEAYTIKNGKAHPVNGSEDARMHDTLAHLNTYGSCTEFEPLSGCIPMGKDARRNYKGISFYSPAYAGKIPDLHENAGKYFKLRDLAEKKYYDIYKAEDFEKTYDENIAYLEEEGYGDLCDNVNRQLNQK